MNSKARFDPQRLSQARRWHGLRKLDLAQAAGVSPAAITQYELGQTRPSPRVVAALALRFGLPVQFFEAGRPIAPHDLSGAHFRSLRSTTQAARQRALAQGELTWEVAQAVERFVRLPQLAIVEHPPPPLGDVAAMERVARQVRRELGVKRGPIPHVVRLLEARGVLVSRLAAVVQDVDAFSHRFPERPIVMLNPAKGDAARARLDAAHELGHLVMHHDADPGSRETERQAQTFSGAFLAPGDQLADEVPRRADWDQLIMLKQRWGMSIAALLYRARELGILRDVTYRNAMMTMSSRGWRTEEPGDLGHSEQPNLFGLACARLAQRDITVGDIAEQCQLPPGIVLQIMEAGSADALPAAFSQP